MLYAWQIALCPLIRRLQWRTDTSVILIVMTQLFRRISSELTVSFDKVKRKSDWQFLTLLHATNCSFKSLCQAVILKTSTAFQLLCDAVLGLIVLTCAKCHHYHAIMLTNNAYLLMLNMRGRKMNRYLLQYGVATMANSSCPNCIILKDASVGKAEVRCYREHDFSNPHWVSKGQAGCC